MQFGVPVLGGGRKQRRGKAKQRGTTHSFANTPLIAAQAPLAAAMGIHGDLSGLLYEKLDDERSLGRRRGLDGGDSLMSWKGEMRLEAGIRGADWLVMGSDILEEETDGEDAR